MTGIVIAVVVGIVAYLLLLSPIKPKDAELVLKPVRVLVGVVFIMVSCIFMLFVGLTLGMFLELVPTSKPQQPVNVLVGLVLLLALGLPVGYIGIRLIVMKGSDSLFKRAVGARQPKLMPLRKLLRAIARTGGAPANALGRAPLEVERLREIPNTAQVEGEPPRRWFFSHDQDLLVWFGPDGTPSAFQLAYGKYRDEHALRWKAGRGFAHYVVDDGERGGGGAKQAPFLEPDGAFPASKVLERFLSLSADVPREIVEFVAQRLKEHPEFREDA